MLFAFVLLVFSVSTVAKELKLEKAKRIGPVETEEFVKKLQNGPIVSGVQSNYSKARTEIGRTYYDYAANNIMGRMIAHAFDSGIDGIHVTYMSIFPSTAERYVTYNYLDFGLNIFIGSASTIEDARTGWGRVVNGKEDKALISQHGNGIRIFEDAGEAGYNFSEILNPTPGAGVFPGMARSGDNLVFMAQKSNGSWLAGDTVMVSTDYGTSWTGYNIISQDPLTTDVGMSEMWPTINPVNTSEFSYLFGPDVTATSANGELYVATTSDFGQTYTKELIVRDDDIQANGRQYIVENFNQLNSMYGHDGSYHVVIGAVQGVLDTSSALIDHFPILYWNNTAKELVKVSADWQDTPADTTTINNLAGLRSGNGLGLAYPHLSMGPNTGEIAIVYQQWEDNDDQATLNTVIPSGGTETFLTDIWATYSNDNGETWSDPVFVAGTPDESDIFPNVPAGFVWNSSSDSIYLDLTYMADPVANANVFGNSDAGEAIWYYERVALAAMPADTTGIVGSSGVISEFALEQNYPNPFNPATTIEYRLDAAAKVSLDVYNLVGQKVATLAEGRQAVGDYKVDFDASNLASGVYFYKLSVGQASLTRKMMLLK